MDVVNCTAAAAGAIAPDPIDIPTITFGTNGQAASCWALNTDPGEKWENGDQVTITVDDAGGSATPGTVKFTSAPTVKLEGQTLSNVSLDLTRNTLTIVVTGLSAPTFGTMLITGVKYDVDFKTAPSKTAYGPVSVTAKVNGNAVQIGPLTGFLLGGKVSNAYLSDVSLRANDPEVGLDINAADGKTSTADGTLSDITIREVNTQALGSGPLSLCVNVINGLNPDTVDFKTANVTKTAGDATGVGISISNDTLKVTFTTPATRTAANTFKISGIGVDLDGDGGAKGRVLVNLTDCGSPPATIYSPTTTAGAVVAQFRTGGSDRFQTARRIAEDRIGTTAAAVIARADDFADALAAAGLAGKLAEDVGTNVPILLTNTNSVPSATLNALSNLGVKAVYIVGGTQAVSQGVETQLRNKPAPGSGVFCPGSSTTECLKVVRIAGPNRYATAREVADFMGTAGTVDLDPSDGLSAGQALKTAFLARGDVFADALAVGPLAYQGTQGSACVGGVVGCGDTRPMPILLTQSNTLSPEAAAALIDLGIGQVVIAGGTSAVSDAVKSAVEGMGIKVVRVGGTNRQHTAALIAGMAFGPSFAWPTLAVGGGGVILATGANFPDALAAGPFGGAFFAPIVLTEDATNIGVFTTGFLDLTSAVLIRFVDVVGQTTAVGDAAA
ncbi:MAG: hypothetical protein C4344_06825, partial [Acidimicrobiia bacterium]